MYSWGKPKSQVTHIMGTYLEVLTHLFVTCTPLNNFIEEIKGHPQCNRCNTSFKDLIYQCA